MQAEYTYFALFVLTGAFVVLMLLRMFRAANSTIRQLNYETRRDRLQHERIARERNFQSRALRRGTRKINGQPHKVGWDHRDRRATRDYHVDEAADEVFDPVSNIRGMDVRTPWGWPKSNRHDVGSHRRSRPERQGFRGALSSFFTPKQVVNDEYRLRRQQCIRALVEDRYGRVGYAAHMPDIEWSKPQLPAEYVEERQRDQMLAWKMSHEVGDNTEKAQGLRLVADSADAPSEHRRASGE